MNENYVKEYAILEKSHWWFRVRAKIIRYILTKNVVVDRSIATVLNVGAAGGASSQWLSEYGEVVSLETDAFFIDHLKKSNLEIVQGSVECLPFNDDQFDLVCAFDVLEHISDDRRGVRELLRVCKPGGIVCLTVPAFEMLWSFHDEVNNHYRRYTKRTLENLLKSPTVSKHPHIRYFNFLLFVPVLVARKLSNLASRQQQSGQSDFTYYKGNAVTGKIMEKVFGLELKLLPFIKFPFGVSLLAVMKKDRR